VTTDINQQATPNYSLRKFLFSIDWHRQCCEERAACTCTLLINWLRLTYTIYLYRISVNQFLRIVKFGWFCENSGACRLRLLNCGNLCVFNILKLHEVSRDYVISVDFLESASGFTIVNLLCVMDNRRSAWTANTIER
jgi:hypothetical protein